MYRIVQLCDSKFRDSVGHALLKHNLLNSIESEIFTVSFDLAFQAVELLKPHVLVLNHAFGKRNRKLADYVKRQGGLVTVAFSEGRPNNSYQEDWYVSQSDPRYCDLFLSWNDTIASKITNVPVESVGCPRFDIYQEPYKQLINTRERFCERYNINPNKKIIGFTSSFPQSKFAIRNQQFNLSDWVDLKVSTIKGRENPTEFAQNEYQGLQEFRFWIRSVMHEYGDDFEYVVKPHPMCEQGEWDKFAADTGIHLIKADYIFNTLNAVDLLIARADCITHCDAWLLNKNSIHCMIGDVGQSGAGQEATEYGYGKAYTHNELMLLIDYYFSNPEQPETNEYLDKYGFTVQNSSQKCADAIVNLIKDRNPIVNDILLSNKIQMNQLLQKHDIEHFVPKVDFASHFGKASTRYAINEWINKIKQLEAK